MNQFQANLDIPPLVDALVLRCRSRELSLLIDGLMAQLQMSSENPQKRSSASTQASWLPDALSAEEKSPPTAVPVAPPPTSPPVTVKLEDQPTTPSKPELQLQAELAFWEAIRNEKDPALFAGYLKRYPDGQFSEIARARMEGLLRSSISRQEKDFMNLNSWEILDVQWRIEKGALYVNWYFAHPDWKEWRNSPALKKNQVHIRCEAVGENCRFFVDNQLLDSFNDNRHMAGWIILGMQDSKQVVRFSDIRLTLP